MNPSQEAGQVAAPGGHLPCPSDRLMRRLGPDRP